MNYEPRLNTPIRAQIYRSLTRVQERDKFSEVDQFSLLYVLSILLLGRVAQMSNFRFCDLCSFICASSYCLLHLVVIVGNNDEELAAWTQLERQL